MTISIKTPTGIQIKVDGDTAQIGRDRSCHVALPEYLSLQPLHAKIKKIANRWMVEAQGDWKIQVGTSLPKKISWLKPGDVIRLTESGPGITFDEAPVIVPAPALSSEPPIPRSVAPLPSKPTPAIAPIGPPPLQVDAASSRAAASPQVTSTEWDFSNGDQALATVPPELPDSDSSEPSPSLTHPPTRSQSKTVPGFKFNWNGWNKAEKTIIVSACACIITMFMKWIDTEIPSALSNGLFTTSGFPLILFIYPVWMVLKNRPIHFYWGIACGVFGVLPCIGFILRAKTWEPGPGLYLCILSYIGLIVGVVSSRRNSAQVAIGSGSQTSNEVTQGRADVSKWRKKAKKVPRWAWVGVGVLMLIIFAGVVGLYEDHQQIARVKALKSRANPKYTTGEMLDAVCENPSWECTNAKKRDSQDKLTIPVQVVRFTGRTKRGSVMIQWIVDRDEPEFHWAHLDGNSMSPFEIAGFFDAVYSEYEKKKKKSK